jgi:hypothetical protein
MRSVIATVLLAAGTISYAQCPAPATFIKEKKNKDAFMVSSQSRSAAVKPGQTYEHAFIAQPGMDYRLSVALQDPSAGTLSYEVYELSVEKKMENGKDVYKKSKKVLAGSASESLEFNTDKIRKIYVAVSLSGGDQKNAECVGVLIEDKKSTRLGF